MSDSGKPGGAVLALPTSTDQDDWSAEEKVMIEAAGLVFTYPDYHELRGQRVLAPRVVLAKFRHTAERTMLDPLAKQLYCIPRLGRGGIEWTIQTAIDGFRVVAARSGQYAGQTPKQWMTHEGVWVDAWIKEIHGQRDENGKARSDAHPVAARAGILRHDFEEPLYAVATWDEYVQTKSNGSVTQMWLQRGPGQLAKCAEALGLRAAFPQDLSGIYTVDEIRDEVMELNEADPETGEIAGPVSAARKSRVKRPQASEVTGTPGTDSAPADDSTASHVAEPVTSGILKWDEKSGILDWDGRGSVQTLAKYPHVHLSGECLKNRYDVPCDVPRHEGFPSVRAQSAGAGDPEFETNTVVTVSTDPDQPREIIRPTVKPEAFASGVLGEFQGEGSSVAEGGICARCGRPEADEDGGLCGPCEDEVQAEIEAEEQGS